MLAYADNCLNEADRRDFEERMRREPDIKLQVERWRAQNAALRSAFNGGRKAPMSPIASANANAPAPRHLPPLRLEPQRPEPARPQIIVRPARLPSRKGLALRKPLLAALAIAVLFGGLAGQASRPEFASRALANYRIFVESKAAAIEYSSGDMRTLRKLMAPRLGGVVFPDLARGEWNVVGGRVIAGANAAAALLVFENARHDVALVIIDPSDDELRAVDWMGDAQGVNINAWRGSGQQLAIASRAPTAALAQMLYDAAPLTNAP